MPDFARGPRRIFPWQVLIALFIATGASLFAIGAVQAFGSNPGVLRVDVEAGRLHATIVGRPTREVLEAVSGATGVRFFVEPSLLATPLSAHVEKLPIEEGLKRILAVHSYVMIFSAQPDPADPHRLKAVRVYPKGRLTAQRYVLLRQEVNATEPVDGPEVLSGEEVDALLQRHDEITRSATAQRIAERRNGSHAGPGRDDRFSARQAVERVRRVRALEHRKARTLTRRHASETQYLLEARQKRSEALRNNYERHRRDAGRSAVAPGSAR